MQELNQVHIWLFPFLQEYLQYARKDFVTNIYRHIFCHIILNAISTIKKPITIRKKIRILTVDSWSLILENQQFLEISDSQYYIMI